MNKYQRIIRGNKELQPGDIDTYEKFRQLTNGIDFKGKRIIDLGCNLGEMCRLAMEAGAKEVLGIDRTMEFIHDARELNPGIKFQVGYEDKINGHWDIVIASAMFHYIKDHDKFFKQIAKCSDMLIMDVWITDLSINVFSLSSRGLYIPSKDAFEHIAGKYFNKIERLRVALSPDSSTRILYHLSKPKKIASKAILISGISETGKTTMAKEYEAIGYQYLGTDIIFMAWYKKYHKVFNMPYSVKRFLDNIPDIVKKEYHLFFKNYVKKWLIDKVGHDIVIEGYNLMDTDYIKILNSLLGEWNVKQIKLTKIWKK